MTPNFYHQSENSTFSIFSSYYYDSETPCPCGQHFHKNYEIINVIEGNCIIAYKSERLTLQKGDAILIEPFIPHGIVPSDGAEVRSVVFHKLLIYSLSNIIEGYHPNTPLFRPSGSVTQHYNTELMKCFGRNTTVNDRLAPEQMVAVKGCLYSISGDFLRQVELIPAEKNHDSIIQEIIDYVAKNYVLDISLRNIARELGYSYHYLSRIFNNTMGINFKSLLNLYRADYAVALLEDTRMPIGEIAYKSGFQNLRSFNWHCKAIYGKTPRDIRRTSQLIT